MSDETSISASALPQVELDTLRKNAELIFTSDPSNRNLAELQRDPRFQVVSLATLEQWSREDGWEAKRSAFIETWNKEAQRRLGKKYAAERVNDLSKLERVSAILMEKLMDEALQAKSVEGAANALVNVLKMKDDLLVKVADEILPKQEQAPAGLAAIPSTTPDIDFEDLDAEAVKLLDESREEVLKNSK